MRSQFTLINLAAILYSNSLAAIKLFYTTMKILCILFYQTCIYYLVLVLYTHIFIVLIKWYPHLSFCLGGWGLLGKVTSRLYRYPCRIQDGRKKWRENDFWKNSAVDSADTLGGVKNFVEIALFCTFSEIYAFLHFMQIFKMAAKMAGKRFLGKPASRISKYPMSKKICQNRSISHRFQDKYVFVFYTQIQDGCKKWRENNFWEKSPVDSAVTLWVKNFVEITLSCTVSKIHAVFALVKNECETDCIPSREKARQL